jgi:uncharacterized protein involved in exopolysaccharide biosynthesis
VLGALFYILSPRTYQSEAQLFLRVGRESVGIDPAATTGQMMPLYTSDRKDEVRSTQEIFRSRTVAANVVDMLGSDVILSRGEESGDSVGSLITKPIGWLKARVSALDPISDREAAIITVERNLFVGGEQQATMIVLSYSARSPQLAQQVCRAVVDAGQKEYMRVHRSAESTPFFTEQQDLLCEQLDQSLAALREAKNEIGLSSVELRRNTLESKYSAIELDRLSTNQQLATSQASVEELARQLAEVPERLVTAKKSMPNQGADLLRDRLYELQVKSMELESRYSESHPLVIAASDQLAEAEKIVGDQSEHREEATDEINPIHRELTLAMRREQSVVAGHKSRLVALDAQRDAVRAELQALNGHDIKIDQLTRESELAREKYLQYARTMEEARIDAELQKQNINNLSLAQEATLAEKPINPSKTLTAAGSICLAIGGAFALILLGEMKTPSRTTTAPEVIRASLATRRPRKRRHLDAKTNGHRAAEVTPSLPK